MQVILLFRIYEYETIILFDYSYTIDFAFFFFIMEMRRLIKLSQFDLILLSQGIKSGFLITIAIIYLKLKPYLLEIEKYFYNKARTKHIKHLKSNLIINKIKYFLYNSYYEN